MITLSKLQLSDYPLLLEGFNTSFLQEPLKKPTKALLKYLPNGFRPGKLMRTQLLKIYIAAMNDGEPDLSEHIKAEAERAFAEIGINTYFEGKEFDEASATLSITDIAELLYKNDLFVPPHIVLLLYGVDCSEELVAASIKLHHLFFDELVQQAKREHESGFAEGEAKAQSELAVQKKRAEKLQKSLDAERLENKEYAAQLSKLTSARSALERDLQDLKNKLEHSRQCEKAATSKSEQLSACCQTLSAEKEQLSQELTELKKDLQTTEDKLKAAAASAEDARRPRYTPEQLRQLCSAVIDSIQTDRLTPDAILELAKKDFNGTETIAEGWAALSGQAVASLTELLEKLDAQDITPDRLDELARIESNVLIEYSVTRSIKAILLRWLSQASNDRMICQHFEKDEEMTGL